MSNSPKTRLANACDELDTAKDLNEAIHMACGYLGKNERDAIQAVSDALSAKLGHVFELIESVREELA